MQNFDKYCQALGVTPGDGPEVVKKAFRARIKQHHPDANRQADDGHSRLLIEAYAEFKKGVPARPARKPSTIQSPGPARGQAAGNARGTQGPGGAANNRGNGFAGFGGSPFRDPYEAGRRFAREASRKSAYRTIFTPPDENSPLGDIYVNLSDMIWGDDESSQVYGKRSNVREYRPPRHKGGQDYDDDMPAHPYDQAIEYYTRAEAVLRETVRRFERRSNRFKNSWVRDYIGELARVQVLFRDVSKRYPALSGKSLARVRQISELITEIKNSRTA
ncbi:MAG: hypothetical protein RIF32_00795 [Leptospirales bacterium]